MTIITLPQGKVTILYGKDSGGDFIVGIFATNELAQERLRRLAGFSARPYCPYWVRDFGVIVE